MATRRESKPAQGTVARRLESKVAIITGASRGIGSATARLFAQEGASVVLASRSQDDLLSIVADIKTAGGEALAVPTDVGDAGQVQALIQRTVEVYGRLDIAFNNAGLNVGNKPFIDISEAEFDQIVDVNLKGVFLAMKYEIPAMLAVGGGTIVNMSSTAGLIGAPGIAAYMAAKHGVVGLTKAAALDYAAQNIRINALAPGPIRTEQLDKRITAYPQIEEAIKNAIPIKRLGTLEEVAEAALWLCSDAASFITGVTLPVDGGRVIL